MLLDVDKRSGIDCPRWRARFADMLELHDPGNGSIGDCWRACIASIMGLMAEDVPHFVREAAEWTDQNSLEANHTWITSRWLQTRGYSLVQIRNSLPHWTGDGFLCIASGMSPRGFRHCVIYDGMEVVHDPHPSRDGLVDFDLDRDDCHLMLIVKTPGRP
jgi:hypothetical protein